MELPTSTENPDSETDRNPIRVVVIDDDALVVELLELVVGVNHGIDLVGTAFDVQSGISTVRECAPDVVTVDYHLPSGSGFEVCTMVKESWPNIAVLLVTGDADDDIGVRAVGAGFDGFVSKTVDIDTFVGAIRAVHEGKVAFTPGQVASALRAKTSGGTERSDLSEREATVLGLLSDGKNTREIADIMFVSEHTVRSHVRKVLLKLDAHTRLEAVAIARTKHLVSN